MGIYLISPSGCVSKGQLDNACTHLRQIGFETNIDPDALNVYQRFAGTDQERINAITRSLVQPLPIVMASRGGYGISRILSDIPWTKVADSGKVFVGHSDFTAFNLALLAKTGSVSYAGPAAAFDFGCDDINELTSEMFYEVMHHQLQVLSFHCHNSDEVDTRGILWGGNLAMLMSLMGTEYMPLIDKGILFLEDVAEHPYKIERMLIQLMHSGILEKQKAIVFGQFTSYKLAEHDNGFNFNSVIEWLRTKIKVPIITGLPYGHTPVKATLPIGKRVGLATENDMAYLLLSEH